MDLGCKSHLMDILFELYLILVPIMLALLAFSLVVQLIPLAGRVCNATVRFILILLAFFVHGIIDAWLEGALFGLWVFNHFQVRLVNALLIVFTAALHQVISIVITDIDFILCLHLLKDLLTFTVDFWLSSLLKSTTVFSESLLLSFFPLHEDVVGAIGRQLLVPLVHLGHLERAKHVVTRSLIDGANETGVWVGTFGCLTSGETQDGGHEHS